MESKLVAVGAALVAVVPLIVLTLGAVLVAGASMVLPLNRQEHARLITSELTKMARAVASISLPRGRPR